MTTTPADAQHGGRPSDRDLRRLRSACVARLSAIDVRAADSLATFCEWLGSLRGRPIQLIPVAMPATHPCGFWVATAAVDFIVYEANTSRTHQEHIVAHELAHLICCHRGTAALDAASARTLFPDVDPELVRHMLQRAAYTDSQEREAEVMASVILERIGHSSEAPTDGAEAGDGPVARIERSLTYRSPVSTPQGRR